MKAGILVVIFLIVGLIVGFIAGLTMVPAGTTTSVVTQTIVSTSPVTSTLTTMLEKTIEKIITSTLTISTTLTTTTVREVTMTVTHWPRFSPQGRIGEEVGEKGLVFVIYSIEEKWKLGIFEPNPGNKFIVIDIEIKNVYPSEKTVSLAWAYVVDGEGRRYGYSLASVGITGYFPGSTNLAPGESVRRYVAFEIPEASTAKYFIYEIFGERYASIALQ